MENINITQEKTVEEICWKLSTDDLVVLRAGINQELKFRDWLRKRK